MIESSVYVSPGLSSMQPKPTTPGSGGCVSTSVTVTPSAPPPPPRTRNENFGLFGHVSWFVQPPALAPPHEPSNVSITFVLASIGAIVGGAPSLNALSENCPSTPWSNVNGSSVKGPSAALSVALTLTVPGMNCDLAASWLSSSVTTRCPVAPLSTYTPTCFSVAAPLVAVSVRLMSALRAPSGSVSVYCVLLRHVAWFGQPPALMPRHEPATIDSAHASHAVSGGTAPAPPSVTRNAPSQPGSNVFGTST
mmetsp:Transcript_6193/g.15020  ORF Transcript_6193/g.15020 Transcript_6193/m.15020 type:complete len:251 (+) Transcript_6193:223-975(+)